MDILEEINQAENIVLPQLKDFQRATVERVDYLFRNGQDRVLVADEVGMGKTLIAKGVIAKTAKLRYEENDDLFKVVYICSNQSIANQNLDKLDIFNSRDIDGELSSWRLSMQFYAIARSEKKIKEQGKYVQMITLTPETSFKQKSGIGTAKERFLLKQGLEQLIKHDDNISYTDKNLYMSKLDGVMQGGVNHFSWISYSKEFNVFNVVPYKSEIHKLLLSEEDFLQKIYEYLSNKGCSKYFDNDSRFINFIRKSFAKASIKMLNHDLVIMDEFQRFNFLINSDDEENDAAILAKSFLTSSNPDSAAAKIRVLLLSATPYKLYTTLEELDEKNNDEHYTEFNTVIKFLYNNDLKFKNYKNVWNDYSVALRELKNEENAVLVLKTNKDKAENVLYNCICRTERISVMGNSDFIDDSTKNNPLKIKGSDINAYLHIIKIIAENNINVKFSIDYIKSSPYILSFMTIYDVKKQIVNYFSHNLDKKTLLKSSLLWLNKDDIKNYKKLPEVNERSERLKNEVFNSKTDDVKNRPDLFLWVTPSQPYYEFGGVYRGSEGFSKILIFSAWSMVPRMIGSMISYEEERRTIGRLIRQKNKEGKKMTADYFANYRYPQSRLPLSQETVFTLLYPSKFLAEIFVPDVSNGLMPLPELEKKLYKIIEEKLQPFIEQYDTKTGNVDNSWYWAAPMMLDGFDYGTLWLYYLRRSNDEDAKQLTSMCQKIEDKIIHKNFGKCPDKKELINTLVNMTLGSPAVCIYRNLKERELAVKLALQFRKYFNSPERTAIIELSVIQKKYKENDHWQDVLVYCKNGNFQAMIDEYIHLLRDTYSDANKLYQAFAESLTIRTAAYQIETYDDFGNENSLPPKIRTHYAVGFTDSTKAEKGIARKDVLRKTFNSPFWPFVMASTSIGQEGLDFHLYCRKVMHWNLPSNPIDLEQREGRINRFKCLAIRQNIAERYSSVIDYQSKGDLWQKMFEAAHTEKPKGKSDLIPFWCLEENQKYKIERILAHYPISKDEIIYERLIKILSLYRLTLGQPRQEELLEYVFREFGNCEELKDLFINLSPFSKK